MIVASETVVSHQQRDGRRFVLERHTDNVGLVHMREYLASADQTDEQRSEVLSLAAVQINEQLRAVEVLICIAEDRLSLVYQTRSEFAARMRNLFRELEREQLARLARWIRRRIAFSDFTETQVRNAFGLTVEQWDIFRTRLQRLDEALALIETVRGDADG